MRESVAKTFCIAGPCLPEKHHMLPALPRLPGILELVEENMYFVIHAPRQSGKTTLLKALTKEINSQGKYYTLYCSLETLDCITDDEKAMRRLVFSINDAMEKSGIRVFQEKAYSYDSFPGMDNAGSMAKNLLNRLCKDLDKELVVFFDEADCLSNEEPLVTFLRQIRLGYNNRSDSPESAFPRSMALVGLRDVRDYLWQVRQESESRGLASPFNITTEKLTLADFTYEQIRTLYKQHTNATGQVFEDAAFARAWYWSEGQPWLVNALAWQAVSRSLKHDLKAAVTGDLIDMAADELIRRHDPHLSSLLERLEEPRVTRVIEPIIFRDPDFPIGIPNADLKYATDLGLVRMEGGECKPSNPIYQEAIVRHLTDFYSCNPLFCSKASRTAGRTEKPWT
jgi:hypothetical protein